LTAAGALARPAGALETQTMSTILISLLRRVDAFEHLRAAVCAAGEYHRELSARPADEEGRAGIAAIAL
jgi:hypothetical protein